jgi:hypothetical protein
VYEDAEDVARHSLGDEDLGIAALRDEVVEEHRRRQRNDRSVLDAQPDTSALVPIEPMETEANVHGVAWPGIGTGRGVDPRPGVGDRTGVDLTRAGVVLARARVDAEHPRVRPGTGVRRRPSPVVVSARRRDEEADEKEVKAHVRS